MYEIVNQISNTLMQPALNLLNGAEGIPILFAFLLGIVGALAPCQFTANLGAITLYGNKSIQKQIAWGEVLFFILGKVVVFSTFGAIVWILGNEVKATFTLYFPWLRKLVGPILIISGLIIVGYIKLYKYISFGNFIDRISSKEKLGAFLLGVSFSLGFCPTMFVLFFINLIPLSLTSPFGITFPTIFALGTSMPIIIMIFLIWYFDLSGKFVKKKGRKIGLVVQRAAGFLMILLGILDILTFW